MTTKIAQFNRQTCRQVGETVLGALKPIFEPLGIVVELGRGTYTPDGNSFNMKVNLTVKVEGQAVQGHAAEEFKMYCSLYGLKETDLGRQFSYAGTTYTLIGCRPKARKFPLICLRADGEKRILPAEPVRLILEKDNATVRTA
jgi:hypothetical protein